MGPLYFQPLYKYNGSKHYCCLHKQAYPLLHVSSFMKTIIYLPPPQEAHLSNISTNPEKTQQTNFDYSYPTL